MPKIQKLSNPSLTSQKTDRMGTKFAERADSFPNLTTIRSVSGFVTDDGSFFESKEEALLHDAEFKLNQILTQDNMSEDIIEWLNNRYTHVLAYLRAYEKALPNAKRKVPHSSIPPEQQVNS